MIGAIILAAGSSRRFGDDKRKSRLPNGDTLLEATIHKARGCLSEVLVVLRADDHAYADTLANSLAKTLAKNQATRPNNHNITFYLAPDSAQGMAHSLANGISQTQDWEAALVMLGDMPFVDANTIETILNTYAAHKNHNTNPAPIIVPCLGEKLGHPVLFSQHYFAEIANLTGDRGARPVIDAHPENVVKLPITDNGVLLDIDRPTDLPDPRSPFATK
jgi:molybdenum cofactor cytidylyltransferase